MKVNKRLLLYK